MKNTEADKRTIVGFDMDGVILDLSSHKIAIAKRFGLSIEPRETASDLLRERFSKEDYGIFQRILYTEPESTLSAPLIDGVVDNLEQMMLNETPFHLISRRRVFQFAIERFKTAGLWPKYFNEKNTFFVDRPADKNTKARELGVTHFIDDETAIIDILHDVPNKILFDPQNAFPKWDKTPRILHMSELGNYLS